MADNIVVMMTLLKVEGDVQVRYGSAGTVQGYSGMAFPNSKGGSITIGPNGKGELIGADGVRMVLQPNSTVVFYKPEKERSKTLPKVIINDSEFKRGLDALRGNTDSMVGVPCV